MWPFRRSQPDNPRREAPDLIIAGIGVRDRPEMTVEVQRVLLQYGSAFSIGLTPAARSLLKAAHVQLAELDDRFAPGRNFAEVYADIIASVLERASAEKPAILLTHGNPLFMNTVARTLVMEGRRLQLRVQVLPGVSVLDTLVNEIGLDVGTRGLQVFDAHWLVANELPMSPKVPAFILNLEGFGLDEVPAAASAPAFDSLAAHLERFYGAVFPVTMVRTGPAGGLAYERTPVQELPTKSDVLPTLACLFLDVDASEHDRAD